MNKSLFTYERTIKITLVVNSIPSKRLTFTIRGLESSLTCWVIIYRESSEAFSVSCKKIFGLLKVVTNKHLFQQHDFPFKVYKSVANTNSKKQGLFMDQDGGKP